jgi:RNA polymerase sigma-70 factor (ECF subfamily)
MVLLPRRAPVVDLTGTEGSSRPRDEGPRDFDAAFVQLYPRCLGLAFRMLGNRQSAEDVAAETMARALLAWDRLDPDRVAGWVLRVTANQSIDLMRRKGRVLEVGVVNLEESTTLRLALVDALQRLPKRQREAIALRYLSDLSEAETAAALGISAGSVKTHVHRGLATLRARLGDETLEAVGAG